jgi:hypothetical protein
MSRRRKLYKSSARDSRMVEYKEKCFVCKKNMVLMRSRRQKAVCTACQFRGVDDKPITDPEMKKLFDIDEKLYERSYFLRDIKAKYLRFGSLSEKQIDVFRKVALEEAQKLEH